MRLIRFASFPCAALVSALIAQAPPTPRFDVAAIKPSAPGSRMTATATGGTFIYQAAPVKLMMMQAFEVQEKQISGDPGWVESELWDLTAKVENEARVLGPTDVNPRLRTLLAERFALKTHREMQQQPVFALVLTKGGQKLKPRSAESRGTLSGSVRAGFFRGGGVGLARLTQVLGASLGRPVLDRTGLSGEFDFEVTFSPDSVPDVGWPGNRPTAADQPAGDPLKPTLFVALEEQLGLKLESTKGPVEMLVIDHVERPSAN